MLLEGLQGKMQSVTVDVYELMCAQLYLLSFVRLIWGWVSDGEFNYNTHPLVSLCLAYQSFFFHISQITPLPPPMAFKHRFSFHQILLTCSQYFFFLPFSFSIFAFSFASKVNLWLEMRACFAITLHWVAIAQKPTAKLIVQLQVSFLFLQLSIWPAFPPCLLHTYLFNFNKTFMFCNALWLCPDTDFFFI